ncbi:hypothetical protein [Allohahella sp. A8]|uniref:hypothetical protein n=1 Tax=Allohahella sp. A8 TaxID=3141461 RepID=UPI003A80DB4C
MNHFEALSIAGLLASSMSANAAVITLPATASFDIRGTSLEDFRMEGSYNEGEYELVYLAHLFHWSECRA